MSYTKSKLFLTTSKRKIKYLFLNKNSGVIVVFFHGFMSNMIGKKPSAIQKLCKKNKTGFLKFEYSGHGKSSGDFTKGNISQWTNDAKQLIKAKVKSKKKLVFVGSSMGSWIALNLFKYFNKQIKFFVGIASAPDFLEELMWKKFSKKVKKIIINKKFCSITNGGFVYPITKQLIEDGRKNKVLSKKINFGIPIILFHGSKDKVVPVTFSKRILKLCKKSEGKLIVIKNGDHSLSKKNHLKKICNELNIIITNGF